MTPRLLVALGLLLANGFFVASEIALIASRRSRIEQLALEGGIRARAAKASLRELSLMLAAAQLGVTAASLGLGYIGEPVVSEIIESLLHDLIPTSTSRTIGFLGGLGIVVFLHLLLGEMVPKNVALFEPERSALWLSVPMRVFARAFRPVVFVLNSTSAMGLRLLGVEPRSEMGMARTNVEIAALLATSRNEGTLQEAEHALMSGALELQDRLVGEVMVPLSRVVGVPADASVASIEQIAVSAGHSRLPVYGNDRSEILGFIHTKDLLIVNPETRQAPLPPSSWRPLLVASRDQTLQELLLTMRRARRHVAVVVGSSGETLGIVTLEDLLEALLAPGG